ncbi:Hpt domain-containing protein [Deinococcus cellulosilyticus]|uniref:HPt domain-containing protein n=1 Tax=Deinococcus cellulosilyticus (strain DSM 18568 / NBRC 106333 / KACC 11606 / 5516J-15) TaxID=1223518 RepID=A0A511MVU1_DEIC1|nr:Hpt domain-containing protein [Deinococcus cellulosilyticus]GEM44378.1 hypothetical protein DC3_00130 [Deinococcus cellulosilyticus NBRC 106333 = KACC 11606]
MSAFLQEFQLEAEDNLTILEQGLLQLEQLDNPEVVRRMFTAAHTIKGSAGMLGLQDIQRLTHVLEDVLDDLRKRPRKLGEAQASVLLEVVDEVRKLCAEVMQPVPHEHPMTHWLEKLRNWEQPVEAPAQTEVVDEASHTIEAGLQERVDTPAAYTADQVGRTQLERRVMVYDPSATARMHQAWLLLEAGFAVQLVFELEQFRLGTPDALWLVGFDGEASTRQFLDSLKHEEKTGVMVSVSDEQISVPSPFPRLLLNYMDTPQKSPLVETALKLLEVQA